jgi:hypothetical protein
MSVDVEVDGKKLENKFKKEDKYLTWLFQPHTLIALIVVFVAIIYIAFNRDDTRGSEANVKV